MGFSVQRIGSALAFAAACCLSQQASAFAPFTIEDIRTEGLQRLEIGTVLTYLPLSVGDELNQATSRRALRALYQSGLFDDAALERDGSTLVIRLVERPAIAEFEIDGNEKISGDEFEKSLTDAGLAEGELLKRDLLTNIENELRTQYLANGFYDVSISSTVEELPNNRVRIDIKVIEGKITKIDQINVLGNAVFSEAELLEAFELSRSKSWRVLQSSDKYSKQKLSGDLESLTSYYQDRGYLQFGVSSVQVQLTPEKDDIFLTVNVVEGDLFKVSETRFSGDTIIPVATLEKFLSIRAGDTYSRKEATDTADRIEAALSDVGYAFAEVTPIPEVDEDKREVGLNFYVEPGKRTYVRRIEFSGNAATTDETLRREMRQLEAAPFSKALVERSRVRLSRLPFIEEAEVETDPVPGSDDQVDVRYSIKERPPGAVQFGIGYSGYQGFLVNGSVTHTNWLGTGNRISIDLNNSTIQQSISVSWTDPYFTADGISQTASLSYRKADSVIRYSSGFNSNILGLDLTYGIPLSEYSSLRIGGGMQQVAVSTYPSGSSDEVLQFVVDNGSLFYNYQLHTGIARDTRNRTFFATRGSLHQLYFDINVPGSDLQMYQTSYRGLQYVPLMFGFFMEMDARVTMVDDYAEGGASEVPPWENLFAGGPNSVRGYRDGSLGPLDTPYNNPYGGHFRTTLQSELIIPLPVATDQRSTRLSAFYDVGQTYAEVTDFDSEELRQAAGFALQWFTPFLGLLELSYAFPLNAEQTDYTDRFQITFGTGF